MPFNLSRPPRRPKRGLPRLSSNGDGTVTVTWEGEGVLEAAQSIAGPWQTVDGATSPHTFDLQESMVFGRILTD